MKSQKKSSTKVRAKNAAPTGQRQYSNLLRSQAAVVKAKNEARSKKPISLVVSTTRAPIALASQLRFKAPQQRSLPNGGLCVSHCEFVGPVFKPSTNAGYADGQSIFQAMRLRMNPGSKATFVWLSTMAPLYESFRFRKLKIHYETRCSTTDRGSIIMSPDYDAADGQIALNEQLLFSNKNTVDDAIWKHVTLKLDPAAMNRLYKGHPCMSDLRYASTNQDQKTIDPAQVFVCVDSDAGSAFKYGKIFIEYEVEFFDPQNPSENPSMGGFVAAPTPSSISVNSSSPISAVQNLLNWRIADNVLTPTTSLPEVTVYPTAVLGRFARDYQGVLDDYLAGTGPANATSYYLGSDFSTPAGTGNDTLVNMQSLVNTAGTLIRGTGRISALAGQYLKVKTPTWTTMSGIQGTASGLPINIV